MKPVPSLLSAAVLLAVLAGPGALASVDREFPVASLGDIWFQADHAAFRDDNGAVFEEYYFRITNNQVRFRETTEHGPLEGRVFIKLEFLDEDEKRIGEAKRRFEFLVPDATRAASVDHAQILLMREPLDPRASFVKIEIEDLNARKRGILYMVTGKKQNGTAAGRLERSEHLQTGDFATSDIQFAWSIEPADAVSDFEKSGFNVTPNPGRAYGLLQSEVSAYYEVYDTRGGDIPQLYLLSHQVLSPSGRVVYSERDTLSIQGLAWARVVQFDASEFPSGEYRLRAELRNFAGGDTMVVERQFGLVWGLAGWGRSEEDILDEARVLFEEDDFKRFREMSSADREVYLSSFWTKHDPTQDTRENELRATFLQRVKIANEKFGAFGQKGMLTDQGRIFIRFGTPDEISRELMPTQGNQLDQFIAATGVIEDPNAARLMTNDSVDTRPYEVWIYTRQGSPLFPEREFSTSITGLQFVFIDETGTGRWVLRYQSDFVNY